MRESSPDVDTAPVLGALHLLNRKTGDVISYIALDTERVTLGRERECDIRLYFGDVSKLHAEIVFDQDSGLAELVVHGNNGLIFTPAGGHGRKLTPPSSVSLDDGDRVQIRQKLFRFSYGDTTTNSYQSPGPKAERRESRRLSHRLSIVPQGKRFAPSPAKPRPIGMTPARSGLSKEVHPVEEEDELVFDELLDVAEGEEGDRVYIEKREDENAERPPINPFMTPQPKGKAALRNTSAVPRTRTLTFSLPDKTAYAREAQGPGSESGSSASEGEEVVEELGAEPYVEEDEGRVYSDDMQPPQTPTPASIPLPPAEDDVTYSPMGGPRRPTVTPRRAYATPRGAGSDSLRRALLLRSAHRALEASVAATPPPEMGLESEIMNGHVEVRRRRSSGRKTLSPPQVAPLSDSDSSEEVSSDEDKENAPQQLQWVYENGQAEVSQFDDSDSDRESSFEMDYSIPGQHILNFQTSPDPGSPSESDGDEEPSSEEDEEDHDDQETVPVEGPQDVSYESDEGVEVGDLSSDIDDEVDRSLVCAPDELDDERTSPLPSRFYTPQPKALGRARISLAGIGTPASFKPPSPPSPPSAPIAETPAPLRIPATPRSLGRPQRVLYKSPAAKAAADAGRDFTSSDEEDLAPPPQQAAPVTPFKTPSKTPSKGLTPAQRAALATPLALPAAPAESFRESVHKPAETRRSSFLDAVRASVQNSAKKAVSFDQPEMETPSRPAPSRQLSLGSIRRRAPQKTKVDVIDEGVSESLPPTPTQAALVEEPASLVLVEEKLAEEQEVTPRRTRRRSMPSPSLSGLRDLLSPKAPRTPSMAGMRELFRTPRKDSSLPLEGVRELMHEPKHAKTPSFAGMRDMFRIQSQETPAMGGVREMFAQPVVPPTPAMDGVAEMFPEQVASEEANAQEEEREAEEEEDEMAEQVANAESESAPTSPEKGTSKRTRSKVPTRSAPPSRTTRAVSASSRRTATPAQEEPAEKAAEMAGKPAPGSRSTRRAPAKVEPAPALEPAPARKTRLRGKADTDAEPSGPPPTRRAVSAPTRRLTRARTAELEDAPEPVELVSAPTRRSRRVLGEAEQPTKAPAPAPSKAAAKTQPKRKPSATLAARKVQAETEEVVSTANKENSATPDPEAPKRRVAKKVSASSLPVRVTRSRKA